jgi:hypothetical protein
LIQDLIQYYYIIQIKFKQFSGIIGLEYKIELWTYEDVKETALNTQQKVISHWHFVESDKTDRTFFT